MDRLDRRRLVAAVDAYRSAALGLFGFALLFELASLSRRDGRDPLRHGLSLRPARRGREGEFAGGERPPLRRANFREQHGGAPARRHALCASGAALPFPRAATFAVCMAASTSRPARRAAPVPSAPATGSATRPPRTPPTGMAAANAPRSTPARESLLNVGHPHREGRAEGEVHHPYSGHEGARQAVPPEPREPSAISVLMVVGGVFSSLAAGRARKRPRGAKVSAAVDHRAAVSQTAT
jgi:hypothetical protein